MSEDASYADATPETADTGTDTAQAHSVGAEFDEATPAEPMSREEYANYMRQEPAADTSHGYASEPGEDTGSRWSDPAEQAQGMTREQYASQMHQGPAAGTDNHDTGSDHDMEGSGWQGDASYEPRTDDPAEQAQGMSRSEYADYMRQGPAAAEATGESQSSAVPTAYEGSESGPGTADLPMPAQGDTPRQVPPAGDMPDNDSLSGRRTPAAADNSQHDEQQQPDKPLETNRPGHPDIHDRYPPDYRLAPEAPPPGVDGAHESPEKWLDAVNPDKADDARKFNCGDCSRSVDSTWHGYPAVAAAIDYPRLRGELSERMAEWAGVPSKPASMADIGQCLSDLGPGSSAIVGCDWKTGGGHWFNAVNDAGAVKAVDGQGGDVEAWPPTSTGLGYDESEMRRSDAIFFTPDGKVVKDDHP